MKISVSKYNIVLFTIIILPFLSRNMVLLLILFSILASLSLIIRSIRSSFTYELGICFLFFICHVFSVFFARDYLVALRECVIILMAFLWMMAINGCCRYDKISVSEMIDGYNFSALVASILYIIASTTSLEIFSWVYDLELVKTSNHFAFYIGGAAIINYLLFVTKRNKKNLLNLIINFVAVYLATGRGMIVAIVVTIIISMLVLQNRSLFIKILLLLLIGLFLMIELSTSSIIVEIISLFDPESSFSNRERFALWNSSLNMAIKNPLGVGASNWMTVYVDEGYASTLNLYPHVHCVYIQVLCELGFHGLILFVLLIGVMIKKLLARIERDFNCMLLDFWFIYSGIAFVFNNPLNNNKPLILFYMFVGMGMAVLKKNMRVVLDIDKSNN